MTPTEIAYLAGYLDGEGSFYDAGGTARLSVGNTYRPLLERLHRHFGGSFSRERRRIKRGRQMWQWVCCGEDVKTILSLVRPYLVEKGPQADMLLEALKYPYRSARRTALRTSLKALKRIEHD